MSEACRNAASPLGPLCISRLNHLLMVEKCFRHAAPGVQPTGAFL
jgi:hypothetical protein